MIDDEERLVVLLEARIRDLEKNMAKASGVTAKTYREMSLGSKRATAQMEADMVRSTTRINQALAHTSTRIGSFGKAFIGGLAVGAAVGALEGIRQAAVESTKSILELSDQAKMAGVSFRAFQQLKFVAEQNRIGVDALTDGLKELNLRADEFVVTGKGSAAEAFQRLGYTAEDLAAKLKQPDQLFLEIIGKLEKLDKAAQIRVSDELFGGTGGEKFVQLISQGERGIRAQIRQAEELGIVMDENMVQKAEEVNQKFSLLATTIGTNLKSAIVDAVSVWMEFVDSFKEFKDQNKGTLSWRQAQLGWKRNALETERMKIQAGESWNPLYWNPDGPAAKGRIAEIEKELARIAEEEAQVVRELGSRTSAISTALDAIQVPGGGAAFAGKGMLDLIGHAEGTDKGRGYNETLAYGKFSGGDKNLVLMTLDEIDALQTQMLRHPDNTYNSSAVGRYQIVQKTLRGLRNNLGISGSEYFTPQMQDRLAQELLRQRGNDPTGLRNEWEGLRRIDDATIRRNFDAESLNMEGQDAGITAKNQKLKEQSEAYADVIARAKEFIAGQDMESGALGMTTEAAARLRYEQELLNEARQAGIDLSPDQIENIKRLAAEMAVAEERTRRLSASQEALQRSAEEFGQRAKTVVGGFISDLRRGVSASDALNNALSRIADMMLDDLLSSIFKVNGASAGGGSGWMNFIGNLFKPTKVGLYADGAAFTEGISGYSSQIVRKPTMFAFANGAGLMGEAGPEAVMPLRRDGSGRLGVEAHGGGADNSVSIEINNYSGQEVRTQEQERPGGGRQITMQIGHATASALVQGGNPLRKALQDQFGLKPRMNNRYR